VLAVSEKIRKYVESLPGETDTETFPNAVSVDEFSPENESNEIHDLYGGNPVFFCLTRLIYKKGVGKVLEAAKLLESDSEIVIAGDGPDADEIRTMANYTSNVHVIGNLSDKKLKKYYASATGFLFTSKTGDAFPTMSVLEAMSSGTPVITPEVDNQMNGFVNGKHGYMLSGMTGKEFANRIDKLASEADLAEDMGINCRKNVMKNFSIDCRVDELEAQYDKYQPD
jgi:glycosyltransferase involved in cell wall biosynthesis